MIENPFIETHKPCPCGQSSDACATRADGSKYCYGKCGGKNFPVMEFWEHLKACTKKPYAARGVPAWVGERLHMFEYVDAKGFTQFFGYEQPNMKPKYRRALDKHDQKYQESKLKKTPLWGIGLFDPGTTKNCVVVEGEPDWAAAYFMLNEGMANETPVYAIPGATISDKDKPEIYEELSKYERVIVCVDNDEAGKKAREALAILLPKQIRVANAIKHKDANDYLLAGDVKDFKRAVANATHYTPEYIFTGVERFTEIWNDEKNEFYVPTGIPTLDELVPGIPTGHITLIAGSEGIGKTEILRKLAWSILNFDGPIACPLSLTLFEEDNKTTLKSFGCYHQNINFRDRNRKTTVKEITPTLDFLGEKLHITDLYRARDEMSVKSFMEKVDYLVRVLGVKFLFFDPINQLRPDAPDEPLVKFLDGIAMELARYCVDNQVGVVMTAHVTDDGKTRDSRMIAKAASIRINVERDLESFDPDIRNTTYLKVTKNRPFSLLGDAGALTLDQDTFTIVPTSAKKEATETFAKAAVASVSTVGRPF